MSFTKDFIDKTKPTTTTDFRTLVDELRLLTSGLVSNVRAIIAERRQRRDIPYAGYVRFGKRSSDSNKIKDVLKVKDEVSKTLDELEEELPNVDKRFEQFIKQNERDNRLQMLAKKYGDTRLNNNERESDTDVYATNIRHIKEDLNIKRVEDELTNLRDLLKACQEPRKESLKNKEWKDFFD